ncbi:hypothetical protein [Actinomadura sp. 9N407]|uniref:hypothetical protein n=1 Tax=Actinomadura sp. 9N407 TaxID=3375154 RepID=UPI0037B30B40
MRIKVAAAGALATVMVLGSGNAAHADDAWRSVPLNWTWSDRRLNDVEAVSVKDVWAVGGQGKVYAAIPGDLGRPPIELVDIGAKPLLQRWTGTRWTSFSPPGIPGEGEITEVEAIAANDVWVSGFIGYRDPTAYLAHWDGAKWTQVTSPTTRWGAMMWADSKGLWLRGQNVLHRFADGKWTDHELSGRSIPSVLQTPSGHLYAFSGMKVHHWDGNAWSSFDRLPDDTSNSFDNYYTTVGDGELWAIARGGEVGTVPAVHRWTGTEWALVPVPEKYANSWYHQIYDLGGPVIQFGKRATETIYQLRWTGTEWTELIEPTTSVPSVPVVAGDGSIWAGGSGVHRLVGKTWTPVQTSLTGFVRATPMPGSKHLFAWSQDMQGNLVAATNAP